MRLTKKKVLQITAGLFGWLEDNPKKTKSEWPEWKVNGGNIPALLDDCACCDYVGKTVKAGDTWPETNCERCPLIKLWPFLENSEDYPCNNPTYKYGYYYKWDHAKSSKTKKKYARIIKEGALKELSCLNAN